MKKCYQCGQTKDKAAFYKNSYKKDGLQTICKPCSKIRRRCYYETTENKAKVQEKAKERKRLIANQVYEFLEVHPCVDCGETDPVVLEFDHVRGQKVSAVSKMLTNGFAATTIFEEIEKCDVRCANCHRRRTAKVLGFYKFRRQG